jgi:hypothetical protein
VLGGQLATLLVWWAEEVLLPWWQECCCWKQLVRGGDRSFVVEAWWLLNRVGYTLDEVKRASVLYLAPSALPLMSDVAAHQLQLRTG